MKILIIRLKAVGDTILITPVFKTLKKFYPDSFIEVILYPEASDVLIENPYVDKITILKRNNFSKFIFYLKSIFKKYDVIIDYINNPTSTLIAFFTKAKIKIGTKNKRNIFYTHRIKLTSKIYTGIKNLEYLKPLNIQDFSNFMPEVFLTKNEVKNGEKILKKLGIPLNKKIIGIFASAKYITRKYPPENFAQLAKIIATKTNYNVILLFGYNDTETYNIIKNNLDSFKKIYFAPLNLKLRELASIIKKLSLLITSDTGPKHLANGLNIKTLTIFSSTDPYVWNPPDFKKFPFIRSNVECIGCEKNKCDSLICMKNLSPDEIFKFLKKFI